MVRTLTAELPLFELLEEDYVSNLYISFSMCLICMPILFFLSLSGVLLRLTYSFMISMWMGGHFSFKFSFSRKRPSRGELILTP